MPRPAAALLLVSSILACARAYPPPGGERDTVPPRLLESVPAALTVHPGFTDDVIFRFDETLSERGIDAATVLVSPLDGTLLVKRDGREIRVNLAGGWRPDRIYRVVVLPTVRDRQGNTRRESAETVFSTGPPIPATAIAGILLDRVTGGPAQDAVVEMVRQADSTRYVALGDTAAFFSLRHAPVGTYDVTAYSDANSNRRLDPAEARARTVWTVRSAADTITAVLEVLAPDSTAPRVVRVQLTDSLHVRLHTDDYIDPDTDWTAVQAALRVLPDSTPLPDPVARVLLVTEWELERRATRPPADSAAAVAETPAVPQASIRPAREVIIQLNRPLTPGGRYLITVAGLVNLHGLVGGGAAVLETPPRAPDEGPADGR